jgi:hypothetical protein
MHQAAQAGEQADVRQAPASTDVTTRWRGGNGGTWGARNNRPRRRRKAAAPSDHGSCPSISIRPAAGGNAQAMACSSVVLPAPEGPITATCSPAANARSSDASVGAAVRRAAGCRNCAARNVTCTREGPAYFRRPALRAAASMPL